MTCIQTAHLIKNAINLRRFAYIRNFAFTNLLIRILQMSNW